MNDPEKAKYLEENLAAIPDCAKSAVNGCLGTLTNLSYNVDENGVDRNQNNLNKKLPPKGYVQKEFLQLINNLKFMV